MEKIFINEAVKKLSTSRTTVYNHIKTLELTLQKEGKKSYLTLDQFKKIQTAIKNNVSTKNTQYGIVDSLKKQIKELEEEQKRKDEESRRITEKNRTLEIEKAKLEGRNETLENQNNKLFLTTGKLSEQVQQLVLENKELTEPQKKSWWQVWK